MLHWIQCKQLGLPIPVQVRLVPCFPISKLGISNVTVDNSDCHLHTTKQIKHCAIPTSTAYSCIPEEIQKCDLCTETDIPTQNDISILLLAETSTLSKVASLAERFKKLNHARTYNNLNFSSNATLKRH